PRAARGHAPRAAHRRNPAAPCAAARWRDRGGARRRPLTCGCWRRREGLFSNPRRRGPAPRVRGPRRAQRRLRRSVTSSGPSARLRASIGLVLLAMFAVVAAARALDLWWRHNEILAAAERRAEGLALIVDEHMRRSLAAIDAVLAQLALHAT